jgi:hypothetical protein
MPKLTAGTGSVQIDDGVYAATLLSIELCEPTAKSPNQNPWMKWLFHVYDSEEGQELTAASSTAFGPKAKARQWIEALLSKKLEPGEEIDTETLAPKDCQVVIKNDAETGFARIQDVMGIRRRGPSKRPVTDTDGVTV